MLLELWQFEFMRHAIYAAILASIACGIVGTFVVVKRLVFLSGGIAHTAFGGIGLGYYLGWNPVLTMIPFSMAAAILISIIRRFTKLSEDSAIGMLWAFGMALGILFIGLTPGYTPDLFTYLFGNILTVPVEDLLMMIGLDVLLLLLVLFAYQPFKLITFDEEYAKTRGVPVFLFNMVFFVMVALTIVMLVRIVGIILVISLLTIPASIGKLFSSRLSRIMILSVIWGIVLTGSGLIVSYLLDLPSGAVIILLSLFVYAILQILKKIISQMSQQKKVLTITEG
ncbi:MAG: hypothetical protein A2Y40_04420 [Candidatus Margulisbacteria bacterium GWF2_35_9]|nr:MAG: hypothetical protein A2Y40_04420 [Candidatus Margulisbacteria bacterium GWF2_35_9]